MGETSSDIPKVKLGMVFWVSDFPNVEQDDVKRRPAVVVHICKDTACVLLAVTTKQDETDLNKYEIETRHTVIDSDCELPKESWVVPGWVFSMMSEDLLSNCSLQARSHSENSH